MLPPREDLSSMWTAITVERLYGKLYMLPGETELRSPPCLQSQAMSQVGEASTNAAMSRALQETASQQDRSASKTASTKLILTQ